MAVSGAAAFGTLYFFINTIALLVLGFYVYAKIYSKSNPNVSALTYFWGRRRIFSTLIIMFLDASTDISVLINWYLLMTDSNDYISVNMYAFFWPLIGFFILYNIIMLFIACDSANLYDLPLVIFQLFPFRTAYISLIASHDKGITNNKPNKTGPYADDDEDEDENKTNLEQAIQSEQTDQTGDDHENKDIELEVVDEIQKKQTMADNINTICEAQSRMLLIQGTMETLPGLVLQSVFWVRSVNDPRLAEENSSLVVFSVIASLFSVSARYVVFVDREYINVGRGSCCNLWYWISIIYRILSIIASFVVFVMLWVVVGGIWILFWIIISFVGWKAATYRNGDAICSAQAFGNAVRNMIALTLEYRWTYHLVKFIQDMIGMIIIVAFLYTTFDCGDSKACVSGETRKSYQASNNRIAFLFLLGWIASFVQFLSYVMMYQMGKIKINSDNKPNSKKKDTDNSFVE